MPGNKVVARSLRRISQQHRGHGIAGSRRRSRVVGEVSVEIKTAKRALRWRSIGLADHVLDQIDAELETMRTRCQVTLPTFSIFVLPPDLRFTARITKSSKPGRADDRSRVSLGGGRNRLVSGVRDPPWNLRTR